MKTRYITYSLLIVLLGGLIFYRVSANKKKEQGGGGPGMAKGKGPGGPGGPGGFSGPMTVNGVVLTPRVFANSLSVSGSIEGNEQVDIRTQVSGVVTEIYFQEGTNVSAGQALIKVDDSELRASLEQAETRQALAAEREGRSKKLLEKEAISQEEYDVASADFRALKSQTQLIKAQLAKTIIKAPFSGKIGLRSVSKGQFISPEIIVTRLVNLDPVKITLAVPEKYSGHVKLNTKLSFKVSGTPEVFTATIYAIEPGVDASSRTLQLRAKASNNESKLIPGTFASINLPLEEIKNAILVPSQAIVPIQNGKKVFVTVDGKASEVMVETSGRTEKEVLITSGLKAGDTVLTTGIMGLKSGIPVKVRMK